MLKVPDGLRSVTTIQEFSSRTIRVRMAPMGKSGLNMNNRISDEKLIEKVKQGEAAAPDKETHICPVCPAVPRRSGAVSVDGVSGKDAGFPPGKGTIFHYDFQSAHL